ncbi:MAG: arginine N-succinyltransferase [Bdellovibrionota bacterium]
MQDTDKQPQAKSNWLKKFAIILLLIIGVLTVSVWLIKTYIFPSEFSPIKLRAQEEQVLDRKIEKIGEMSQASAESDSLENSTEPKVEKYQEIDKDREISFTEKELNALIARNKDLAKKLAVNLSENMLSANLLIPLDPDFPVFGGKTLRLKGGLELSYRNGKPIVIVKGLSIMGVPVPNAWMGGIKNIDLVSEFAADQGFWKSFEEGVEHIEVRAGSLKIKLKE